MTFEIPKNWVVVCMACDHRADFPDNKTIVVDPNGEFEDSLKMTPNEFVNSKVYDNLDLGKTFCICKTQECWDLKPTRQITRMYFKNMLLI